MNVGVVPPLRTMLAGRGDDGGIELCLAIIAIFFLRVERRVLIIATTKVLVSSSSTYHDGEEVNS